MQDWDQQPEASGPQTESDSGQLFGIDYGQPGQISIGRPPRQMPVEMMQAERDLAERRWLVHQRIEAVASTIAISALEAGKITDEIEAEITEAADRAVSS